MDSRNYEGLPFEVISQSSKTQIRKFSLKEKLDDADWHRDADSREVSVVSGSGWLLQIDNRLPVPLEADRVYTIQKGQWHRILRTKKSTDLVVRICMLV